MEDIIDSFAFFDASKGYFNSTNQRVYDALWEGVFESLTRERLPDCVNIWLLQEDQYLPKVREVFGSDEGFYEFTGYNPMGVQGVNVDGTWIVYRGKNNLAMLADVYHEIGHRVFLKSADRFHHEIGANYFMFLALKKANIELKEHGLSIPYIDFGEQITGDHDKSLKEARRLVDTDTRYVHKVE